MSDFIIPRLFGRAFDAITKNYLDGIGFFLSPVFHIITLLLIIGIFIYGNKIRRIFSVYYLINYIWLFCYVGIYMFILFFKEIGFWSFIFWGPMPVLLLLIIISWITEIINSKIDLDLKNIKLWRFIVVPVIIFGFWYPTFIWGKGFIFLPKDFLFSFYGLMPCPTTMFVLGILSLKYPSTNKLLFVSMTIFAAMVGTAQIKLPYIPDIPLAIIGYYCILLIMIFFISKKIVFKNKK